MIQQLNISIIKQEFELKITEITLILYHSFLSPSKKNSNIASVNESTIPNIT